MFPKKLLVTLLGLIGLKNDDDIIRITSHFLNLFFDQQSNIKMISQVKSFTSPEKKGRLNKAGEYCRRNVVLQITTLQIRPTVRKNNTQNIAQEASSQKFRPITISLMILFFQHVKRLL